MSLKFDLQNTLPCYLDPLAVVQQRVTDCLDITYPLFLIVTHLMKQRFSKNQKPLQGIWRTLKASLNPLELFSRYGAIPLLNTRILPGLEISRQTAKC